MGRMRAGGNGAAGPVQPGRELVRTGYRPAGAFGDDPCSGQFVRRIAGRELRCNGEPRNLRCIAGQEGLQRLGVQRRGFGAAVVMPAGQHQRGVALQHLGQPVPVKIALAEPDVDEGDAPALPLDQRVGGKRGGK